MFGWFRRNIRKVEVLGVGVEFHAPTDAAAATTPKTVGEVLPPDPTFLAQLKHVISNTMLMIDEVSGTDAVMSMGLEGEKYRLRACQRTDDVLFGAEANTTWPVGQDTTAIEAAIDDVIDTEKQKSVEFMLENRGNRKHLLSVSCFTRQRFYEFSPAQFRDWVSLHTAVIASIDKRLRGEIRLGSERKKPANPIKELLLNASSIASGVRSPAEGRVALRKIADLLDAVPEFTRLPGEDRTSEKLRTLAGQPDDSKVLACCRLVAENFARQAKNA